MVIAVLVAVVAVAFAVGTALGLLYTFVFMPLLSFADLAILYHFGLYQKLRRGDRSGHRRRMSYSFVPGASGVG